MLGDCTNGGFSSRYNMATLTGVGVDSLREPDDLAPELMLVRRMLPTKSSRGARAVYFHAIPFDIPVGVATMFGGNFIYSSDSRFPCDYPIPVHDRIED
jgi:hypothetical protein